MHNRLFVLLSLCLLVAGSIVLRIIPTLPNWRTTRSRIPRVSNARIVEAYGKLPLSFEANQGQTASDVKFLSRGSGYNLFLTSNEAVLELRNRNAHADSPQSTQRAPREKPSVSFESSASSAVDASAVLRMTLVGANPAPQVAGLDELPGKTNYFIGNDPAKWRTNVPTFAKVRYENVYSGIDLVYYGNQRRMAAKSALAAVVSMLS